MTEEEEMKCIARLRLDGNFKALCSYLQREIANLQDGMMVTLVTRDNNHAINSNLGKIKAYKNVIDTPVLMAEAIETMSSK